MFSFIINRAAEARVVQCHAAVFRDFKDKVYPIFESDTLFPECCFVLF